MSESTTAAGQPSLETISFDGVSERVPRTHAPLRRAKSERQLTSTSAPFDETPSPDPAVSTPPLRHTHSHLKHRSHHKHHAKYEESYSPETSDSSTSSPEHQHRHHHHHHHHHHQHQRSPSHSDGHQRLRRGRSQHAHRPHSFTTHKGSRRRGSPVAARALWQPQVLPGAMLGSPEGPMVTSRLLAEKVSLWDIGKGFVVRSWLRPWQSPTLKVLKRGTMVAPPQQLCQQVPDQCGIYLLLVKPPGGATYLPVYLGRAGPAAGEDSVQTMRSRFASGYLANGDGTFGPCGEVRKYLTLLDLQRRGFSLQVRFRPVHGASAKDDESAKLRKFNFAYNYQENVSYRPLKLPCGRRVVDYPVLLPAVDAVYQQLAAQHPDLHSIEEQYRALRVSSG